MYRHREGEGRRAEALADAWPEGTMIVVALHVDNGKLYLGCAREG